MSGYRLLKHHAYDDSAEHLSPATRRKATWSQVLLGTRGRTPNVKTTTGYNARWRRTPVQGYHYYLWWIPLSETNLADGEIAGAVDFGDDAPGRTILVHSIRHHDETDNPIILHSLDEFTELPLVHLDPRFDEQQAVGDELTHSQLALAAIKGLPGSGKTISLFYLVRDLAGYAGLQQILYVTYTARLKRAAREFLAAQGETLAQHVHIRTFNELVGDLLGTPVAFGDPFGDLRDFTHFLDLQSAATLGPWRKFPATLYTELRAYLFGRTFPDDYTAPDELSMRLLQTEVNWTAQRYAANRDLDAQEAELAFRLAERLRTGRFFADQRAATKALPAINAGRIPAWLRNLDAIIVDEVQDMTLVQLALLGELARSQQQRRPNAPLAVALAGDESQIVQPSGFEWGATKDLMRAWLGVNPLEFEYRHQRRSPRNIARIIDNAWNFYSVLPKQLRPSANRQSFVDDAGVELAHAPNAGDDNGRLLICPLPPLLPKESEADRRQWQELVGELANLPGRALIDLTETLLGDLALPVAAKAEEVVFLAREIKGLERTTVLIHGLEAAYQTALRLADAAGDNLPRLEARRLIDEMRVALSRATEKLVILEAPAAAVLAALNVGAQDEGHVIGWDSLLELLRNEEMSEIELVEGYLDEVDDLLERGRWEQARQRNRRAYAVAQQINDRALQLDAQEQYIQTFLREADAQVGREDLRAAHQLNRQAFDLADALGDPAVLDEVDEQLSTIRAAVMQKVDAIAAEAASAAAQGDLARAFIITNTATDLYTVLRDPTLQTRLDEATVAYGWQWATQLLDGGADGAAQLPPLFRSLAIALGRQADAVGVRVAELLDERYTLLPARTPLPSADATRLLGYIDRYLDLLAPLSLEPSAFVFVARWLEEAFDGLGNHTEQYCNWAILAQRYAAVNDYPSLDERLWDLENRVELMAGPHWKSTATAEPLVRFAAVSAAYNGEPAQASLAWEKLGQLELAIAQSRAAGDLERTYTLLRRTNAPIPEELAIAVKLQRLVEQMHAKHLRLDPAEQALLGSRLQELAAAMTAAAVSPPAPPE